MTASLDALPAWDTAAITAAVQHTAAEAELRSIIARAEELSRTYRGRLAELGQDEFELLMAAYQSCVQELQRGTSYAELAMTIGDREAEAAAALARCDLAWSKLTEALGFVEPELAAMPAPVAGNHPLLAPDGMLHNFYRRVVATSSTHDEATAVLAAMRPCGVDGWQTLARQLLSRIQVVTPDGVAGIGSAMTKFFEPDRSVRLQAYRDITHALGGELDLRATVLSMIVLDGLTRAELTGTSWLDETLVSDQLTMPEVDALVAGAAAGYPIVHEYYRLKARLLGQARLDEADRYAPVGQDGDRVSWSQATETVLAAFDAVHPRCGAAARQLLAANRIDAASRPGKGTGFTKDVPGDLPWISVNFDGSLRHVLLLAHELGHGVHLLMSAHLPLLAATTPRVLAET
ncbi:MAG TPA: hypothetical protein VFU36_01705, partial [Jatrophihabitans sp.]|nr:hypothetical protein [Jatrophihabitans sp.]